MEVEIPKCPSCGRSHTLDWIRRRRGAGSRTWPWRAICPTTLRPLYLNDSEVGTPGTGEEMEKRSRWKHGGPRPGSGRPPILENGEKRRVYLEAKHWKYLEGRTAPNVSAALREILDRSLARASK